MPVRHTRTLSSFHRAREWTLDRNIQPCTLRYLLIFPLQRIYRNLFYIGEHISYHGFAVAKPIYTISAVRVRALRWADLTVGI